MRSWNTAIDDETPEGNPTARFAGWRAAGMRRVPLHNNQNTNNLRRQSSAPSTPRHFVAEPCEMGSGTLPKRPKLSHFFPRSAACFFLKKGLTRINGPPIDLASSCEAVRDKSVREITAVVVLPGVVIIGFLPAVVGAQSAPAPLPGPHDTRDLAQQVGTILADHCVSCHGPEQKKGGLDLSRRATALAGGKSGSAIVPGEPDVSLVVERVSEGEMPPKGALSREQVTAVRAWIEAGATYASEPVVRRRAGDDWWSLRPIRKVAPPHFSGSGAAWIKSPVDAFILAGLKSRGLLPAPEAEPRALIRRLTFDLTGLPPRPEEVDAFIVDKNPRAYEQLVDRLLASPHYGERWGRHWLDVVRFGESQGYETNLPRPSAWPYRDYVIRAFNRDTPFPQFVFEQLAADTLVSVRAPLLGDSSSHIERADARATVDWLTQAATGFLVGGTHDVVGNQTVEGMLQQRADDLDDMITATGTAFLGLTVQCARCHDHKFDPILHTDYYGLQAIFAGVNHAEREIAAPDAEVRRQEAAAAAMELASLDRIPHASAAAAQTSGSTIGLSPETRREQAELIARLAKLRARLAELGTPVKIYAGSFTEPRPTHLLIRGDPTRTGPVVRPAALNSVAPRLVLDPQTTEADRRRALARWIADPANPLPGRVMVNRVWQYHFGRGIVSTPSDFGFNGAAPSHPELLDWLASAYIAAGWQLKPIHRLIVTSAAYRQSNQCDDKGLAFDRHNLLLWRMAPRRLEAESIRDAILAASGRLDTRIGGPGYNVWEPNTNYVAVYKPRDELGPDTFRRMIYQFKPRSQPDPTFGAFDCPDAALVAPRRNVSTTALQALNLLNSRFILQQATHFAERLEREAGPDRSRQAERGFALAFGRPPSSIERDAAVSLIASHGAAAFCRALYNANEFVYVP
jgi:mono/diheme cytochrome c family protein